ncbi:MAG: HIT domain-containing protein [Candidatus Marinimicrobia bacterium]|nr:HIT domain-containing protein [Candidatus Neomarinimicrobiota bacterium]
MDRLWAPWRLEYIQGPEDDCCIFCVDEDPAEDQSRLIVERGEYSYVIMNRYPYSNGHLMVSPYRHLSDPGELEEREVLEIHQLMVCSQRILREVCAAQGFNVGWNIGQAAGAGIADHIHMHIVPRWRGDSNFMPILADTRVIPQHIERTYTLLAKAFPGFHCNPA